MVTTINEKGEKETYNTDQFFLHLREEKNNEHFADQIVKIFKKAGYLLEKGIWAD